MAEKGKKKKDFDEIEQELLEEQEATPEEESNITKSSFVKPLTSYTTISSNNVSVL